MKTEIGFWDTSALLPLCCVKAGVTNRSRAFQPIYGNGAASRATAESLVEL